LGLVDLDANVAAVVVRSTERTLAPAIPTPQTFDESDDEDDELAEPVKVLEQVSDIKEITVWGHDQHPLSDDAYYKGVNEWLDFAQAIHGS
jgi:ribonuclease H2 subunit C